MSTYQLMLHFAIDPSLGPCYSSLLEPACRSTLAHHTFAASEASERSWYAWHKSVHLGAYFILCVCVTLCMAGVSRKVSVLIKSVSTCKNNDVTYSWTHQIDAGSNSKQKAWGSMWMGWWWIPRGWMGMSAASHWTSGPRQAPCSGPPTP